jgi:hypothetical protein
MNLKDILISIYDQDKELSPIILRRVQKRIVDQEFIESLQDTIALAHAGRYLSKPNFSLAQAINKIISMTIDGIHYELFSKAPEDSQWYDTVFYALKNYYGDVIEEVYDEYFGE